VDGLEAVEKTKSLRPDIVLMDISMPRMNGVEATRIIHREVPESKVILISQNDPTIVSRQAAETGASGYVAKSDLALKLVAVMNKVVGNRSSENRITSGLTTESSLSHECHVPPESVIGALELKKRPSRSPDYQGESGALVALAQEMANSPRNVLQKLVDIALELSRAHSAGVSILEEENGRQIFRWHAVAGQWSRYAGGTMPRESSPCGTVLDRNAALLLSHPERYYSIPPTIAPAIVEVLLIPFYVAGEGVGTIWVIAHDESRHFDGEDERLIGSLGKFASSACQTLKSLDALTFEVAERKKIDEALRQNETSLRDFVDNAPIAMHCVARDGRILWANQAELDLLGYAGEEYIGHHVSEFHVDAQVIGDILARLSRSEVLRQYEARLRTKAGAIRHVLISSSALFEDGKFVHSRCFSLDITERKQAEAHLRENERRFREMIDSLPAAIYTTNAEGRITHFNPAAVEFSGRVPELGSDQWCVSWKMFRPDGTPMPHDECPMAVALREGRIVEGVECIAERPDGRRVWFTPYPRPLRDAEGRIVGGINMLLDISERKQAERATSLLAAIVDSSDDAIISMDLDAMITSWNRSAERLFGYTAEEAIGQHITLVIPPDRRQEEAKILERLKRGEPIEPFETVRMRKDGTTFEVSLTVSPVKDAAGRVTGISRVPRDITRRKESERTTGLLAAIVESSDDAIVSKSLDGTIRSWNKSAKRIFGYTAEEAVGQHITIIIPPDRRQEEATILERLKRDERVDHFETLRVRKDGTAVDISLTISPVKDANGRIVGASKVARDVTDRKRAEQALRESKEQLRSLADGLETQVRVRTQELEQRNADVLEHSEQLRELSNRLLRFQDNERRRIARELHDSAGQIITALGMSIANIGQHTTHHSQLARSVQDSQELVQQLSKEIRTTAYLLHPPLLDENGLPEALRWYVEGLAGRSDLKIELCISESFGRLPGEVEMALFRIVQEGLTNIHRHSGSKKATIRIARKAESVSLDIQDEGKGIPAEKLIGIQVRNAGVGIAGIRERVRHLGGAVSIQSNQLGTTISVTLPIPMNATSQPESVVQQTRAAG
jgi:PAS domain S-box-containing protein